MMTDTDKAAAHLSNLLRKVNEADRTGDHKKAHAIEDQALRFVVGLAATTAPGTKRCASILLNHVVTVDNAGSGRWAA